MRVSARCIRATGVRANQTLIDVHSLGHPGVQFCDSVVQQDPFLDKDVTLLDPGIRYSLDCIKSRLKTSNFSVGFSMCGHLLCSTLGRGENLQVVDTVLVESKNLVIQGLDFSKV